MNENDWSRQEMNVYCHYLLKKEADEQSLSLFSRAIRNEETLLTADELKLLEFIIRHPWSVPLIDATLGMFQPHHRLRKRMIIAFAILETNPLYFDFFKPKQFSLSFIFILVFNALMEGVMAVAGSILLLFV